MREGKIKHLATAFMVRSAWIFTYLKLLHMKHLHIQNRVLYLLLLWVTGRSG